MPRRDFTKVPFAATGDVTSIPTAVQPDGSVSMTTGYGFDYQRDNGAGGGTPDPLAKSIPRDATNGILNEITASIGEIQLNGLAIWAASAAPYPINATVRHNNTNWRSTVANNSAQPGVAPLANWIDTTVQIVQATESVAGIVILSNALNGSAQDKAATENAVGQKLTAAIALGATNLNTLSTRSDVGVYFQNSTSGATTALNYPVLAAGTLLVTPSAVAVQQEYTTRQGVKFVRGQESTTVWSDWVRVGADYATATTPGYVRLASQSEMENTTNGTDAVTPKTLIPWFYGAGQAASEAKAGIAAIASEAFVAQGTNDTRFVTPLKLAKRLAQVVQQATESVAGVMKIATQALTNSGVVDDSAVTPKKLSNWWGVVREATNATESVTGFIALATDASVSAGTDNTRAVTPVKMVRGVQMSLGATGYLVLPWWLGSVKFVWGSAAANYGTAGVAVTYPLAFASAPWAVLTAPDVTTTAGIVHQASAIARTRTGFTLQTRSTAGGGGGTITSSYLAIGI